MLSTAFLQAAGNGDAYVWTTATAAFAAADTMESLRNTHSSKKLYIEKIRISKLNVASEIQIHLPTDTTTALAGTAVTGSNFNTGISNNAQATCKADETGISTQGTIYFYMSVAATATQELDLGGATILDTNRVIAVDTVAELTAGVAEIWGYYK